MRALSTLILLVACGSGELAVSIDGSPALSGSAIDLGATRRNVLVPDRATLTLTNTGRRRLEISAVDLPLGVALVRNDLPLGLEPDASTVMRLGLVASEEGPVEGTVGIEHGRDGRDRFELEVSGEVAPYVQLDLQDWTDVEQAMADRVASDGLVGAAAAIVQGQDIVWMQGFGLADQESSIPVEPSTSRFRWASLSKGLVATTAASAVDDREFSFDDAVIDLIPDYPEPSLYLPDGCRSLDCAEPLPVDTPPITLRQLLSHTAGAQHYSNGAVDPQPPLSQRNDPAFNTGMAWALPVWWQAPWVAVPGEAYSYSTFGYNLAGVAIEEALGEDLEDAVQERISEPLGITTLGPDRGWDPAPDRVAHYGLSDGEVVRDGDNDVSWKLAGGGFESTVEDLARYCAGLLGSVIVRPSTRDSDLWSVQAPATGYGLGFGVSGTGEDRVISHTGAQEGTRTALRIEPSTDRCYVFMTNSTWADPSDYTRLLRESAP